MVYSVSYFKRERYREKIKEDRENIKKEEEQRRERKLRKGERKELREKRNMITYESMERLLRDRFLLARSMAAGVKGLMLADLRLSPD